MVRRGRVGPWFRLGIAILKPPCVLFTRRQASGLHHVARVMRGAGQIPVDRDTAAASKALGRPVDALRRDQSVVIYRELPAPVLREATDAIMDAITAGLEVLRGEPAPERRHEPGWAAGSATRRDRATTSTTTGTTTGTTDEMRTA